MNLVTHLQYVKENGEFDFECNPHYFDLDEIEFITKYGHWLQAVQDGVLKPFSDSQRKFIEVCSEKCKPSTWKELTGSMCLNHTGSNIG